MLNLSRKPAKEDMSLEIKINESNFGEKILGKYSNCYQSRRRNICETGEFYDC
jgi:hypothetical protein